MAYLTPANSGVQLPPMPLGPGSGFMWGMNIDAANQMNQRMLRDNDLEYAINQIKQQADQSNLDVTKAKNMNELLNQAILKQQYDSGGMQTAADAALNANISGNQAKAVQSQDAIQLSMQAPTVQMAEYIKARGGKLDPTNQADIDEWNKFSSIAKYHGIKTPDFPDPQQQQALMAKRDAYIQSADYQQKMGVVAAQNRSAETVAGIHATATENAAATHAGATVDAAKISAGAREYAADQQLNAIRDQRANIFAQVLKLTRQYNGNIPPEQLAVLRQNYRDLEWQSKTYSMPQLFASLQAQGVQGITQLNILKSQVFAQADAQFDAMTGTQSPSSASPTSSSTPNDSGGPVQLKGSKDDMDKMYNSLKSGDTYIDPNGVTRRKQ